MPPAAVRELLQRCSIGWPSAFEPVVTILDLLFNVGSAAAKYFWQKT